MIDNLNKIFEQDQKENELKALLDGCVVDMSKEYSAPQNCITIHENGEDLRLFTLGNISSITGKQKSKKTFLISMLIEAASRGQRITETFNGHIDSKCIFFDTEQSTYDSWKVGKIMAQSGANMDMVKIYSLRPYSPKDRLNLIEYAVKTLGAKFIVIDGIADLVTSINSEEEAVDITTRLMRWTKEYNCHISNVIHQRKADSYARGHLGTALLNKSETIISCTKIDERPSVSTVKCDDIRGAKPFEDLEIEIREGRPFINKAYAPMDHAPF